jgi:hypothetical protein
VHFDHSDRPRRYSTSSWPVVCLAAGLMVERPMPGGFAVGAMKRALFGRLILLLYGGAELAIRSGSMVISAAILCISITAIVQEGTPLLAGLLYVLLQG